MTDIQQDIETCVHDHIVAWRIQPTGDSAGFWSCASCNVKFVPITELFAMERERDELRSELDKLLKVSKLISADRNDLIKILAEQAKP